MAGTLFATSKQCGRGMKMTEQVEQQISIKFFIKLERSSMQTIQVIQKATAMGNW